MVVGINPVRGPAHVQAPEKSNFDKNMDSVARALGIANAGMGIAVNYQKFNQVREQRDLAPGIELDRQETHEQGLLASQANVRGRDASTAQTLKQTAALPDAKEAAAARARKVGQARTDREQSLFNDFRTDRRNLEFFDSMDNASKSYAALVGDPKNATPLQVSAAQRMVIRSIEPGIINQADLQAYSPDSSARTRMERFLSLQAEGKPLEMDAQAFKDFATLLQHKAADDLRQAGATFANSPKGKEFGATEDVMNRVLRVEDFVTKAEPRPLGGDSPESAGFNLQGKEDAGGQLDFSGFGADAGKVEAAVSQMPEKDRARFLRRLQEKKAAAAGGQ